MKNTLDILALGLILQSVGLFFIFFFQQEGVIKWVGVTGSILVVMVQSVFFWQKKMR